MSILPFTNDTLLGASDNHPSHAQGHSSLERDPTTTASSVLERIVPDKVHLEQQLQASPPSMPDINCDPQHKSDDKDDNTPNAFERTLGATMAVYYKHEDLTQDGIAGSPEAIMGQHLITQLQNVLGTLGTSEARLRHENEKMGGKLAEAQAGIKSDQALITQLQKDHENMNEALKDIRKNCQDEVESIKLTNIGLQKDLRQSRSRETRLQERIKTLEAESKVSQTMHDSRMEEMVDGRRKEIERCRNEYQQLKQQYKDLELAKNTQDSQLAAATTKTNRLRAQYTCSILDGFLRRRDIEKLTDERARLRSTVDDLANKVKEQTKVDLLHNRTIKLLREEKKQHLRQQDEAQEQNEQMEERIRELLNDHRFCREQVDQAQAQNAEALASLKDNKEKVRELEQANESLRITSLHEKRRIDALEHEKSIMMDDQAKVAKERNDAIEDNERLQSEKSWALEQLSLSDRKISRMQAAVNSLNEQLQSAEVVHPSEGPEVPTADNDYAVTQDIESGREERQPSLQGLIDACRTPRGDKESLVCPLWEVLEWLDIEHVIENHTSSTVPRDNIFTLLNVPVDISAMHKRLFTVAEAVLFRCFAYAERQEYSDAMADLFKSIRAVGLLQMDVTDGMHIAIEHKLRPRDPGSPLADEDGWSALEAEVIDVRGRRVSGTQTETVASKSKPLPNTISDDNYFPKSPILPNDIDEEDVQTGAKRRAEQDFDDDPRKRAPKGPRGNDAYCRRRIDSYVGTGHRTYW